MASITDYDKIRENITRPYSVVRSSLLSNSAMRYRIAASVPKLRDSLHVYSLSSAKPKPSVETSSLSRIMCSESFSNALRIATQASQRLGKWIIENEDYFTAPSMDAKSSVFLPANIEFCDPTAGTNKRLDRLNDNSEKTTELLQLMVDVARSTSELNQQMASTLDVVSHRQEQTNTLAINHHSEDVKSAKKESFKSWINIILVTATLIATIYGIFH